jgi:hypothetical protein
MYKELTLYRLSSHLGRSKSTLSRHTRDLIQLGLIEAQVKDIPQPGTIKRKYYTLSKEFNSLLKSQLTSAEKLDSSKEREEVIETLLRRTYLYRTIKYISDILLRENKESLEDLYFSGDRKKILSTGLKNPLTNFRFLTENQYERVHSLSLEFNSKLEEVLNAGNEKNIGDEIILREDEDSEKPYLFTNLIIPIIPLRNYEQSKDFLELKAELPGREKVIKLAVKDYHRIGRIIKVIVSHMNLTSEEPGSYVLIRRGKELPSKISVGEAKLDFGLKQDDTLTISFKKGD